MYMSVLEIVGMAIKKIVRHCYHHHHTILVIYTTMFVFIFLMIHDRYDLHDCIDNKMSVY